LNQINEEKEEQKDEDQNSLLDSCSEPLGNLSRVKKGLFQNNSEKDRDSPKMKEPVMPKAFTKHVLGRYYKEPLIEDPIKEESESDYVDNMLTDFMGSKSRVPH